VFVAGTIILAAGRATLRPVINWLARLRRDSRVKKAIGTGHYWDTKTGKTLTVRQENEFRDRYPDIKWPLHPMQDPTSETYKRMEKYISENPTG
jgi:hypothetical protein